MTAHRCMGASCHLPIGRIILLIDMHIVIKSEIKIYRGKAHNEHK